MGMVIAMQLEAGFITHNTQVQNMSAQISRRRKATVSSLV